MKRLTKASMGEAVNFCPYGCTDDQLDGNGYCRHLIGFTNDQKFYEPLIFLPGGERVVRVPMKETGEVIRLPDVTKEMKKKPVLQPIREGDKLEQITVSYRVYRDVDKDLEKVISPAMAG
jgi:hypothetical protein